VGLNKTTFALTGLLSSGSAIHMALPYVIAYALTGYYKICQSLINSKINN
jgi:hypothetical protein